MPVTTTLDRDYFRALRKLEPVQEQAYPAPEHTSRDPWPADFPAPGPVLQLQKLAESEGWAVRLQYSRNHTPRVDNGKPGAMAHHVVVQAFHPESRSRLVAHYVVPVRNPSGAKWLSTLIVSPTISPYAGCSITDAKQFIRWRSVDLDAIRVRNASKSKSTSKSTSKRRESGG